MSNPVGAQRYGLGGGDAYYDAVKYGGYTGTREQFGRDQAEFAENATAVAEAREEVERNTQTVVNTTQTFTEETVPAAIQSVEEKGDTEEDRLEARTTELVQSINTAGAVQVQAVEDEGTKQIGLVSDAGIAQVEAVEQAGEDQVDAVEQAGADQIQAVTDEGTTQVGVVTDEGDTQVQRVQDKGNDVLESIPSDYTELVGDVDNLKSAFTQLDVTVNGVISQNYTEGKNLSANSTSHNIIDDADSYISDYIVIPTGITQVKFWYKDADTTVQNPYQIWFFDSSYTYITFYGWNGASSTSRNVNVPTNAAYARFSFNKNYVGRLTENSNTPSAIYYEAGQTVETAGLVQKTGNLSNLETTEKTNLVGSINEVKNSVPEFPINPDDTSFFHISKNMIDPSTCVPNEYVNQQTGAFASLSGHNRTDYIEINPSTTYVVRTNAGAFGSNFRYVFYTSAKAYISGAVGALPDMLLTSPANAKYIVISETSAPSNMMIAPYVDEDKSFEAFDNVYVKPQYIVVGDADDIVLNLPEKVYALVGYELNIYFDNITENSSLYKWDVTCTKGMQLERGYRITPVAADVGTYTLTIRASISENIYKEVSTTLVVTAATTGSGETATVIILGDSTTDNGGVITKLHEDFADDVMGVSTLGTRGTAPNNHEGRSGWSFNDYLTKASITYPEGDSRGTIYNPFYNPISQTFDANYYFANSGIAKPDWFFVNLGINDMYGFTNDAQMDSGINTAIERCNTIIDSVLSATTTTKVGICLTIPCNHSQDAFGKAYACSQTRDRYKRNNTFWVKKMIEEYSGRENERIYIIPINASLDTIYNMGIESIPVNSRNEITYNSPIANGGVHPSLSGYWQIADVYTALLKANA